MDEITDHNQTRGIVVAQQFFEALFDYLHSPKRKKVPSGALAQFVSKMKIGHREPAFSLMKKSEAPIEKNVFPTATGLDDAAYMERSIRAARKLSLAYRRLNCY